MEIEIYRNNPAGARCNQLVENVLVAIIDSIDELDKELTIKIVYVKEGIKAPAIKVDSKVLGEGLSMESIVDNFSPEKVMEIIKGKER